MIRAVLDGAVIEKAPFVFRPLGFMALENNYYCAVCRIHPAMLEKNWFGILQPCRECQKKFKVIKLTWFDRLVLRRK